MKIMLPLDENKVDVCIAFGRAPMFLLHDTKTNETEYLVNPAAQSQGGAGIQAAQFIVDQKADVLITVRCGENAAEVLDAAGIPIYKTTKEKAVDNVTALEKKELNLLTEIHAGFHGAH